MTQKLFCASYEIEIGRGLLYLQAPYLTTLASRFAIITDDNVTCLYGKELAKNLSCSGLEVYIFPFPPGEQHKTRSSKEMLEDQMFKLKLGRDTCVIALGGGVVTDLAGYIAATYCRGIPLVMIPTTLLGMVDASIGGKTGVNVPYGKNMLGCIYPPKKVIVDVSTLKSLPKKEIVNGVVEIIKHGIIADAQLFEDLENNLDVEKAIFASCCIKKEIVEEDEKEVGKRRLLNFGHTIGHALESITKYALSHGEAVAIGILVESFIAKRLGVLEQQSFERIKKILLQYGLPLNLPNQIPIQMMVEVMALDKKSLKGEPRFVIIDAIGSALTFDGQFCTHVEKSLIMEALQWMNDDLCCH